MHGAQKYGNHQRRIKLVETTLAPFVSYGYDDSDVEVYAVLRDKLARLSVLMICKSLQLHFDVNWS